MTDMMMNTMTLTNEALESVTGGDVIRTGFIGNKRTISLATLRVNPRQKSARIAMLRAGTVVRATALVKKDVTYRYRYVEVSFKGKKLHGWVADSLLR